MLGLVDPICEALKGIDDQLLSCFYEVKIINRAFKKCLCCYF